MGLMDDPGTAILLACTSRGTEAEARTHLRGPFITAALNALPHCMHRVNLDSCITSHHSPSTWTVLRRQLRAQYTTPKRLATGALK
jgi:hypothetical protein